MRRSPSSSNRIDLCFDALRQQKRKAFVAYITAGDPHLKATFQLSLALGLAGVDVLELGAPFSDPLADGPVNQRAAERALKSGTTLAGVLRTVQALRRKGLTLPIVLFTYFNPIHRYGVERFARDAARDGVDGVLNLDLPPEEAGAFSARMDRAGLRTIYLIAPTTHDSRITAIAKNARGFIYYVSREGVTGMQKTMAGGVPSRIHEIRRHTKVPVVVGFGISTPEQVRQSAGVADGCVVGSAIVHRIGEWGQHPSLVTKVSRFVEKLARPLRGSPSR